MKDNMDYNKGGHSVHMPATMAEAIPMAQSSASIGQVGDAKDYEKGTFVSLPATAVQAIPPNHNSGGGVAQDYSKGTFVDMDRQAAVSVAVQAVPYTADNLKSPPPGSKKAPPPNSLKPPPPGSLKKSPPKSGAPAQKPPPKNPPIAAATTTEEVEGDDTIVRTNNRDSSSLKSLAPAPSIGKNDLATAMTTEDEDLATMKMDKYAQNAQVQMLSVGEDIESPLRETFMEKKRSSTASSASPPGDKRRMLKIMAAIICLVLVVVAVVVVVVVMVVGGNDDSGEIVTNPSPASTPVQTASPTLSPTTADSTNATALQPTMSPTRQSNDAVSPTMEIPGDPGDNDENPIDGSIEGVDVDEFISQAFNGTDDAHPEASSPTSFPVPNTPPTPPTMLTGMTSAPSDSMPPTIA